MITFVAEIYRIVISMFDRIIQFLLLSNIFYSEKPVQKLFILDRRAFCRKRKKKHAWTPKKRGGLFSYNVVECVIHLNKNISKYKIAFLQLFLACERAQE